MWPNFNGQKVVFGAAGCVTNGCHKKQLAEYEKLQAHVTGQRINDSLVSALEAFLTLFEHAPLQPPAHPARIDRAPTPDENDDSGDDGDGAESVHASTGPPSNSEVSGPARTKIKRKKRKRKEKKEKRRRKMKEESQQKKGSSFNFN